ncbi:hypothetical protein [Streptomyces zaomyceticus]|uniref:hypothetical protein n=1 Tax=Streptomyces zaomyceticus TaxID=68286 RepID=UPI00167892A3|nr:hypothetical protein [Streptomyces zaomyceticus]GHG11720.1 hypothetical protein GCM10018791_26380 [Streptomyces zaomyceticus]
MYQIRKALHLCVDRDRRGIEWSVAIEAGDDIEKVSKDGRGYHQLKHRAPGASLTDASTDLWKTLRIWAHAIAGHRLDPEETDLVLMATAELPSGSAASLLLPTVRQRDDAGALKA